MKLKQFLKNIAEMVAKDPSILDLNVVSSKDEEGNGFSTVGYAPSLGEFLDGDEFKSEEAFAEWDGGTVNAICIN